MVKQITIENFPRFLEISKSRRAKYHYRDSTKTKKGLPKKYQDRSKFHWQQWDKKGKFLLVNIETGERVIANPKSVGTPNKMKIAGQPIMNGSLHPNVRNKLFQTIKLFFIEEFVKNKLVPFKAQEFPLKIEGTLYMPYYEQAGSDWDVDNMSVPYLKAFQDALVAGGYIFDDHRAFICKPLSFEFVPSEKYKMVIKFSTSKRSVWRKIYDKYKITF